MSQTNISGKNQNFIAQWESVINANLFFVGSAVIGATRMVEWVKGPLTTEGMLLASLLNGVATISGSALANKYQLDKPYYHGMIAVGSLAIGSIATPYIASTFLANTAIQISFQGALAVGAVNLTIRATTYTLYKLYQHFSQTPVVVPPVIPPKTINTPQDVQKLSVAELAQWKADLEKNNNEKWAKLPIPIQMAFNKEWRAKGPGTIHFTSLIQPTPFSDEELDIIEAAHNNDRTKEYFLFLYANRRSPTLGNYSEEELSLIPTPQVKADVAHLSKEQIKWHHQSLCLNNAKPLQDEVRKALATCFLAHNLKCPGQNFSLPLHPVRDINAIAAHLLSWYFYDFTINENKWKALSFTQQTAFNARFLAGLAQGLILYPTQLTDIEGANANLIKTLHVQYQKNPSLWVRLPLEIGVKLNEKFKSNLYATIFLPQNATEIGNLNKNELKSYHEAFTKNEILETRFTPEQYQALQLKFIECKLPEVELVDRIASTYVPTWKKVAVIGLCICIIALPLLAVFGVPFLGRNSEETQNGPCMGDQCPPATPVPSDIPTQPLPPSSGNAPFAFEGPLYQGQTSSELPIGNSTIQPSPFVKHRNIQKIDLPADISDGIPHFPNKTSQDTVDCPDEPVKQTSPKLPVDHSNQSMTAAQTQNEQDNSTSFWNLFAGGIFGLSILSIAVVAYKLLSGKKESDVKVEPLPPDDVEILEQASVDASQARKDSNRVTAIKPKQLDNKTAVCLQQFLEILRQEPIPEQPVPDAILDTEPVLIKEPKTTAIYSKETVELISTFVDERYFGLISSKSFEWQNFGNVTLPCKLEIEIDEIDSISKGNIFKVTDYVVHHIIHPFISKEKGKNELPTEIVNLSFKECGGFVAIHCHYILNGSKAELTVTLGSIDRTMISSNWRALTAEPQFIPYSLIKGKVNYLGLFSNESQSFEQIEKLDKHFQDQELEDRRPPCATIMDLAPHSLGDSVNYCGLISRSRFRSDTTFSKHPILPPFKDLVHPKEAANKLTTYIYTNIFEPFFCVNLHLEEGNILITDLSFTPGSKDGVVIKCKYSYQNNEGVLTFSLNQKNWETLIKWCDKDPSGSANYIDYALTNNVTEEKVAKREENPAKPTKAVKQQPPEAEEPFPLMLEPPQEDLGMSLFASALVMHDQEPPTKRQILSESNKASFAWQIADKSPNQKHPWRDRLHRELLNGMRSHLLKIFPRRSTTAPAYLDLNDLTKSLGFCLESFPKDDYTRAVREVFELLLNPDGKMDAYTQRTTLLEKLSYAFQLTDGLLPGNMSGNNRYAKEVAKTPMPQVKDKLSRADLLQIISECVFAGPDLHTFSKELVLSCIASGSGQVAKGDLPLSTLIENDFNAIRTVPGYMKRPTLERDSGKVKGHFNVGFNPLHDNNFASVLYSDHITLADGTEKVVNCLRFGSPTKQGYIPGVKASALEEMEGFLDKLDRNKENYSYFNHQNPFPKGVGQGDETGRIDPLKGLQAKHKNFFFYTLPLDGDFFNGKKPLKFNEFIKIFYQAIEKNKNGIDIPYDQFYQRIPSTHKDGIIGEMKAEIKQILADVYNDYFSQNQLTDQMTSKQCTLFQYKAYKRLMRYFIVKSKCVAYNRTCKDAMDRGGIVNGGTYHDVLVENGEDQNQEAIDDFRTVLHSPAFEIKDQAIISGEEDNHNNRGNLLILSLKHFEQLSPAAKEKLKNRKIPGTTKWSVRCSLPKSQEIYPTYGNAKNAIELKQAEELDCHLIHNKQIAKDTQTKDYAPILTKFVQDIYIGDPQKNKLVSFQPTSENINEGGCDYIKTKMEHKITIVDTRKEFIVIAEAIEDVKNQKIYLSVKRK